MGCAMLQSIAIVAMRADYQYQDFVAAEQPTLTALVTTNVWWVPRASHTADMGGPGTAERVELSSR